MNVHCIVMFEFNYSVGDIRNSDLGEGIVCLGEGRGCKGEGSVGEKGEGSGGKREGSGECQPPVHPPPNYLHTFPEKLDLAFAKYS